MKDLMSGERSGVVISYFDDGTYDVLSDTELAAVVGGTGGGTPGEPPPNTGCNTSCTPINLGC